MAERNVFSNAIRAERKRLGLTQKQLADYAGCGITFINQLERGKASLQFAKVLDVLKVLGLELRVTRGKDVLSADQELL